MPEPSRTAADQSPLVALLSPLRVELLALIAQGGSQTARQLAAQVGRRPSSLYYHLVRLEQAGWICSQVRGEGRHAETLFDLTGQHSFEPHASDDHQRRALLGQISSALLRQASRDVQTCALAGRLDPPATTKRFKLRLSPQAIEQVALHLASIEALLKQAAQQPVLSGELVSLTFALTPVQPDVSSPDGAAARPGSGQGSR
jgi:DNA-binding transcriptional ArsR family regulator